MQNITHIKILALIKAIVSRKRLDVSNKNQIQKKSMSYIIS